MYAVIATVLTLIELCILGAKLRVSDLYIDVTKATRQNKEI